MQLEPHAQWRSCTRFAIRGETSTLLAFNLHISSRVCTNAQTLKRAHWHAHYRGHSAPSCRHEWTVWERARNFFALSYVALQWVFLTSLRTIHFQLRRSCVDCIANIARYLDRTTWMHACVRLVDVCTNIIQGRREMFVWMCVRQMLTCTTLNDTLALRSLYQKNRINLHNMEVSNI